MAEHEWAIKFVTQQLVNMLGVGKSCRGKLHLESQTCHQTTLSLLGRLGRGEINKYKAGSPQLNLATNTTTQEEHGYAMN